MVYYISISSIPNCYVQQSSALITDISSTVPESKYIDPYVILTDDGISQKR